MADLPQQMWVKSNGETIEFRPVSPVSMSFRADKNRGIPTPHLNEVMSLEDARQLARDMFAIGHQRLK